MNSVIAKTKMGPTGLEAEKMEESCDEHGTEVETVGTRSRDIITNQQFTFSVWNWITGAGGILFCGSTERSGSAVLAGIAGGTDKLWG